MDGSTTNRRFGSFFVTALVFIIVFTLYSSYSETSIQVYRYTVDIWTGEDVKAAKYPLTFIPPIGLGTWLSKPGEVTGAVKYAIDIGYRHIDTARIYRNEKEVGEGIKQSGVPRHEIWVTSKLFNDDHHPDDVEPAIKKTLSDLGVGYLDLYLMHWPVALKNGTVDTSITYLDTWHAMESLVDKGLTKNIGISNFAKHETADIVDHARIRPTFHEFETHPYLQQSDFVTWNHHQGIQVIAYSPLANLNPVYNSSSSTIPPILEDPFWISLASKKNATIPQTILAWGMQRGTIVIPKSVHESRILENYGSKNIRFEDSELEEVKTQNRELRFNNPGKNWGADLFDDLEGFTKNNRNNQGQGQEL